jgi:hypothetical protein
MADELVTFVEEYGAPSVQCTPILPLLPRFGVLAYCCRMRPLPCAVLVTLVLAASALEAQTRIRIMPP